MIGLIGVLTAAALTCTSMQDGCAPQLGGTQALAAIETMEVGISELTVPKPRVKPLRSSGIAKQKQKSVAAASKTPSAKPKVKLVMQDDVKKARKKRIPLLIGNYY